MPRRREVPKRPIQPDPKYKDRLVGRFTSVIMRDGKKSTAEHIVYGAFEVIENKTRNDPLAMFRRALENVRPRVEVKSRRVGGATYQVPVEVRPERATSLAMRWLADYARGRSGKSTRERLADEIIDAALEQCVTRFAEQMTRRVADVPPSERLPAFIDAVLADAVEVDGRHDLAPNRRVRTARADG